MAIFLSITARKFVVTKLQLTLQLETLSAPYFLELPASTMLHIDGRHVYLFALGGSRSGALAARTMDAVS